MSSNSYTPSSPSGMGTDSPRPTTAGSVLSSAANAGDFGSSSQFMTTGGIVAAPAAKQEPGTDGNTAAPALVKTEDGKASAATAAGDKAAAPGAVRRKPTRRANTAERRATHNMVERQRRETLNGRFLDLAVLLPNLANARRPSKSAIVNSSIALVHSQKRLRYIAGKELQTLLSELAALRAETQAWRSANPGSSIPSNTNPENLGIEEHKLGGSGPDGQQYEQEIQALLAAAVEYTFGENDLKMNEEERIAYEMRGGDSGPAAATQDDDGDDEPMSTSTPVDASSINPVVQALHQVQQDTAKAAAAVHRARTQSLGGMPISTPVTDSKVAADQAALVQQQQAILAAQLQQMNATAAAQALLPPSYMQPQHQQQMQQQMHQQQHHQQQAQQQQQQPGEMFFPPSFDALAAAASMNVPPMLENAAALDTYGIHANGNSEAAKLAAWNSQLMNMLAVQQQQLQMQQQGRDWNNHFATPPNSSHGVNAGHMQFGVHNAQQQQQHNQQQQQMFGFGHPGANLKGNQNFLSQFQRTANMPGLFDEADSSSGASEDGQVDSVSHLMTPALSLNLSNLQGLPIHHGGAMTSPLGASSLPSSLTSPLHHLNLSMTSPAAQPSADPFAFSYGSAPTAGGAGPFTPSTAMPGQPAFHESIHGVLKQQQQQPASPALSQDSNHQSPGNTTNVGGGGGGGLHPNFVMMSMFI